MFGQPVNKLLREMPAAEFKAWAVWRQKNALPHRHGLYLMARMAWQYACSHRGKDDLPPGFADFYPPARTESAPADSRYTAEERKTLANLMKGNT